ncbi:MAG TPA: aminoglycoside phosphotransferase family protein [Mucilaginibacter sp.]|nr:aminoglycoside phosphotransferase family protein [Mucilaginibacter sp.]
MDHISLPGEKISRIISAFDIPAEITSASPFGSGHINDTYRLTNEDLLGDDYLLQRINHHVFRDVPLLMNNLDIVTRHLKEKVASGKNVLTLIGTKAGKPYLQDEDGNYWRVFVFLKDTKSYDLVTSEKQAYEGGKAFGSFQALLSDLDIHLIKYTIPDFHNIEFRLNNFEKAIASDSCNRASSVEPEIAFIRQRAKAMSEILEMGKAGFLPLRIVHNDTKFNNVLLDSHDNAQCVIDLDTVMPGFAAYDFGDSVRTIINTAAEDEADTIRIGLNVPLFAAYTRGYLQEAQTFLTQAEVDSLIKGALLLPFIQSVRFLTDYLEGDVYFKIHSPGHNLQRTRAQHALVVKLEENLAALEGIIFETWQQYQ